MIFAQIILILVFTFFIIKTSLKYKNKEVSFFEFFGWVVFWFVGLVLSVKPDTASYFAKILGIGRGVDLVIYIALLILFYMQFRMVLRLEKNNREITRLTRERALENKE